MNDLSLFLKYLRLKNKNERLSDMAKKLGISASYLSTIETGKRKLNDKLLDKIIRTYGLSKIDAEKLRELRNLAAQEVNVSLDDMDAEKQESLVKFLSNIKTLSSDDFRKINYLLNKQEDES